MNYKSELLTAIRAVEKASSLCKAVQKSLVSEESMEKKDKSPVTVADFGAQAIVIHELKKAFPDDPIVAEEDAKELTTCGSNQLLEKIVKHLESYLPGLSEEEIISIINMGGHEGGSAGRFWTLDPIDGTKGFLRKEQYAVALALIENGEVLLGVLGCPNLSVDSYDSDQNTGTLLYAVKGQGAFMKPINGSVATTVSVSDIYDANFCESVESGHSSHDDSAKIAELLNVTAKPVRIDSQCKYGVLARGEASIYLRLPTIKDYEEKIWDHAAGYIVVKEAGGEVTDCMGNKLDFSLGRTLKKNMGIVGSNGKIHNEVIKAVKKVIS